MAGQLIEDVSGQTWEQFVRDQVLRPAGMRSSTRTVPSAGAPTIAPGRTHAATARCRAWATQTMLDDSGHAEFDLELGANAAPAGGVASSANDMGRWISIQLARRALPDGSGRLFSETSAREMDAPGAHSHQSDA